MNTDTFKNKEMVRISMEPGEWREAIALDTSVVIEGLVSTLLERSEINPSEIVIPVAVVDELEHQANAGSETGFLGLDELKLLRSLCQAKDIHISYKGPKPNRSDIEFARSGAIDEIIRRTAHEEGAALVTADRVQCTVAEATGVPVIFIPLEVARRPGTPLDDFFTVETMSVHIKEDAQSVRKVGRPGEWKFEEIEHKFPRNEVQSLARAIVEQAGARRDSYVETERPGSTIVQLGRYRCVIAKPPFASGWEITAVRPVKQLVLDEYNLSEKLRNRLSKQAEGVLIAGAPGSGKSTFVQALAKFYVEQGKIVKTVEAPRDLIVPAEITQYSLSHASPTEVRDVLLLNRPDYTIFDEMRNNLHFQLYTDLRLSGVGMVGVVHATKAVDAIQRFMSRIELGVIPHVVDTVIFIKNGVPQTIFSVDIRVKVPSGMTEEDLARPVVCISDFESEKVEYEVYTFGEQTMVLPVQEAEKASPVLRLAAESIKEYFYQFVDRPQVEMVSPGRAVVYVAKDKVSGLIGTGGSRIREIEGELGISIDIREREGHSGGHEGKKKSGKEKGLGAEAHGASMKRGERVPYDIEITKKSISAHVGKKYSAQEITFYDGMRALCTATVNKKGEVHFDKDAPQAVAVAYALKHGDLDVRTVN